MVPWGRSLLINDFNWLYEQFTETTDTTEEWQHMYGGVDIEPLEIQADTEWKQTVFKEDFPVIILL